MLSTTGDDPDGPDVGSVGCGSEEFCGVVCASAVPAPIALAAISIAKTNAVLPLVRA
jgi:hypothetical protein